MITKEYLLNKLTQFENQLKQLQFNVTAQQGAIATVKHLLSELEQFEDKAKADALALEAKAIAGYQAVKAEAEKL